VSFESEPPWLQRELEEAHKTIRSLLRQLDKEQARTKEVTRAYNLTVANLVELTHDHRALQRECEIWKTRAQSSTAPLSVGNGMLNLLPSEVSAIRKAMARLHHPDTGGDSERLKNWNAALDALEP
jgi:chromosome segregation ATPase